jgi:membrane protein DedA with SNARE-associated domain
LRDVEKLYIALSALILALLAVVLLTLGDVPSLGLAERVAEVAIELVANWGYLGIFILMSLESALIPIPSEVVVPLAGYLSHLKVFDFWAVVAATTLANLLGSLLLYLIGIRYGRGFLEKHGWLLHLKEVDLERAERWLSKYGAIFIFIGRMTPALRTVISLPAGVGRMDPLWFSILTFLGSLPWNLALAYAGVVMGQNWILIEEALRRVDLLVVATAILLVIYLLFIRGERKTQG